MLKNTCKTAGVAILAVETGPTSNTVLSKSMKAKFSIRETESVNFTTEIMVMDHNVNITTVFTSPFIDCDRLKDMNCISNKIQKKKHKCCLESIMFESTPATESIDQKILQRLTWNLQIKNTTANTTSNFNTISTS
eukprot:12254924-Ditylum_brightwellii.AAC.1